MLQAFYLSSFFKYYLNKPCFQLPQKCNVDREIKRAISTRTGINEVRLAHHISLVFFEIVLGRDWYF